MKNILSGIIAFLLIQAWTPVASSPKDSVLKVNQANDFELKGDGSSPEWARTAWVLLSKRKGNASYETKFKTVYSEKGIYCLFVCEDSKIISTLKEDFADIYKEDVVEVFFWTDESHPIYFEYEVSPANYELPILVPNHNGDFLGWRPWHYEGDRKTRHATSIAKENEVVKSWTAEFFIPFALLKPLENSQPKKGTRWRANFYRIDYDNGGTAWEWNPVRDNFHDFKRFGVIEFQ